MKYALLMSFVVAAGCVDEPEPAEPEATSPVDLPGGFVPYIAGEQEQGRRLLGSYADSFATTTLGHFHAFGTPLVTASGLTITVQEAKLVALSGGSLMFSGASGSFLKMRFAASVGGELEIVGILPVSSSVTRYQLVHHTGTSSVPYCSSGNGAIPFKGRWSSTGLHVHDGTISFGCDDAVGFKCNDWGYVAGDLGPGSIGWDHHQACTRMARADYCGDGESHTFDGTAIVIRDLIPGAMPDLDDPNVERLIPQLSHPAPPNQFWFESAWQAANPPARCLSRVRWASMPLGGPCPGVLDDPRMVAGAKYCEHYWPKAIAPEAPWLLYNSSKVGQMLMHRWSTNSGQQLVTVRGWHDTYGTEPPHQNYVNYEEAIGFLMRNPPSSLQGQLAEVYSQRDPSTNDRFVGPYDSSSGYEKVGLEGHVYIDGEEPEAWMPDRVSLNLYVNGTDRVSSTAAPAEFPPAPLATLGYLDELSP